MLFTLAVVILVLFVTFLLTLMLVLPKAPREMKTFSGKHVLITGGSKGIGKALALGAVKRGGHVTILARNLEQLKEVERELEQYKIDPQQRINVLAVDLTAGYETVRRALSDSPLAAAGVDLLVNNAGGSIDGPFDQLDAADFETEMRLNYLSAVHVTKALIAGMKLRASQSESGCRIVFLSSQAGQLGLFGYTAYSASKFALRGLAESLQMELAPCNIRVTLAFPPNTRTEGFARECLTMPEATRLISDTAGLMEPDLVAEGLLDAAAAGRFACHFGTDGWMLANLCCGMSPAPHRLIDAVCQIFLAGVFRFVSFFYLKHFDQVVEKVAK